MKAFQTAKFGINFGTVELLINIPYLARLNYVMQNPVRHGLVEAAEEYPWCSTSWFRKSTPTAFFNTVRAFKIDKVSVVDDF